jgi:hypothetical protein
VVAGNYRLAAFAGDDKLIGGNGQRADERSAVCFGFSDILSCVN